MKEKWKAVVGYEGWYSVSDQGRVKRELQNQGSVKDRIMKTPLNHSGGYPHLGLNKNGITKNFTVHRLVAQAFLGVKEKRFEVNHKNSIRTDNRLFNLEWVTHYENVQHTIKSGRKRFPIGEESPHAKLTREDVLQIRKIFKNKKRICKKDYMTFNVCRMTVKRIIERRSWRWLE